MYLPPQFKGDAGQAAALMEAYPFASLISTDDAGLPYVTHLPLHLEQFPQAGQEAPFVLLGHVAKANPHWHYLQARPKAVVTFMGPHAYMTPRVYPDLARVPTWNYITVHCTVEARLLEHFDDKDHLLKHLIADHDPAYANQWRGLGEDYQHKMMNGIVAFELKLLELQCKVKLNQHRPEAHAAMRALYAQGGENEQALGDWMDRLRLGASPANSREA
ncbi:FMN-binding negative transcriptional regulator [Polaromonas sp.]|uniref:FMN-binding negative transcriptional regulator n=1 Tax=Polaromonas sp. TaxID=1869339 RepID=UPI0018376ADA|nr:FMN-binding negative transcriptional regulator [Polaromonas sp.]NMM06786.1 FMN-binding negative transcriptional regulator [Polaromonas sp.]